MAAGILTSIWITTELSCASGAIKGVLPVISWERREVIDQGIVAQRSTVVIPMDSELADEVIDKRVLRFNHVDSAGAVDYDEERITEVAEDLQNRLLTVQTAGIIYDLAEKSTLITETVNGIVSRTPADAGVTPATALARVDAALPAHFAVDTVDPTDPISVDYNEDSPLSAGRKIRDAALANEGPTAVLELSVRRNGSTDYKIDLTAHNAIATSPEIRLRKNLGPLTRRKDSLPQITRAYIGEISGLHRPMQKVTAVTANTDITIEGIEIGYVGGETILLENDLWNTYYWVELKNGTAHLINDTTSTKLLMSSTTTINTGDWGYIAVDSSRNDFPYLDSLAKQALYGVKLGKVAGVYEDGFTNLCGPNADLHDWTGADPAGWSKTGTSATKTTTAGLWKYGGQSARMNAASSSLTAPMKTVHCDRLGVIQYRVVIRLAAFGGASALIRFTNPQTAATEDVLLDGTDSQANQLNTWLEVVKTYAITSTGAKTPNVALINGAGPADVYLDAMQCLYLPADYATLSPAFRARSGAAANIARGAFVFAAVGAPLVRFDQLDVADLYQENTDAWSTDRLAVGKYAALTDMTGVDQTYGSGLAHGFQRIMEIVRRSDRQRRAQVRLETLAETMTRLVTGA